MFYYIMYVSVLYLRTLILSVISELVYCTSEVFSFGLSNVDCWIKYSLNTLALSSLEEYKEPLKEMGGMSSDMPFSDITSFHHSNTIQYNNTLLILKKEIQLSAPDK